MRLRIDKGASPGKVISLTDMVFTIGRELDNQFVINESGVSRHHCTISRDGDKWYVEDRNSVNGVLLNGFRIEQRSILRPGDQITVFNHEFVFLDDLDDSPAASPGARPLVPEWAAPRAAIPWGKLLLLALILGLVVYLAYQVFAPAAPLPEQAPVVELVPVEEAPAVAENPLVAQLDSDPGNASLSAGKEQKTQDSASAWPVEPTQTQPAALDTRSGTSQHSPALSDVVVIDSDPPGAEVYLDGELQPGLTPLLLRKLSAGRHSLEMRKTGYENSMRTIMVPDVQPSRPVVLRQKPGTLLLQSDPPGAHIWKERQFLGVTPALLEELEQGSHELTLRGPGCESKKVSVDISAARGEKISVELQSNLGNLELTTQPANCKVYLQGVLMGVTSGLPGEGKSQPLLLKNIIAGGQRLKIEHSSGVSVSGRIQVPRLETARQNVVLRLPTHQVLLNNGETFSGILLEQNAQGDVVLEDLSRKAERFLKPQIKELRLLSDSEIKELLASFKKGAGGAVELFGARSDLISVNDLRRAMLSMPADDFNRLNSGKVYNLVGRPTMILPESKGVTVVMFTTNIRCQFGNLTRADIEEMNTETQNNVSFQGTFAGVGKDGVLLLKNCILLSEF